MSVYEERESVVLSNEGEKIFGILHLPKGEDKPPCVMVCHGLGGHKTGKYRVYVELAESLIKAKIAVFRFDFRGSGDSEGTFSEMTLQGEVSDALLALDYLVHCPKVDSSRLGVFGRSLGGAVAIKAAAITQNIKSAALWAPLYNGEQWLHKWQHLLSGRTSEQEGVEMRRINGQVAGMEFYSELFSTDMGEQLKTLMEVPLLLMHGEKDEVIGISHSEKYYAARKPSGAPLEFIRLPNGDHDFTHPGERQFAISKTTEWFQKTL
jgi:dipeptidyl aminopeptidase/acylaminoacyl peptidase